MAFIDRLKSSNPIPNSTAQLTVCRVTFIYKIITLEDFVLRLKLKLEPLEQHNKQHHRNWSNFGIQTQKLEPPDHNKAAQGSAVQKLYSSGHTLGFYGLKC